MVDQVVVSLGSLLCGWLGNKAADTSWARIKRYFSPVPLTRAIESALRSDAAVNEIYSDPPTVDRARFTPERVDTLLRIAVEGNVDKLSQFLIDEQVIDLPPLRSIERSYDVIWKCIAKVVLEAISQAVVHDEELFRQLSTYLDRTGNAQHKQLLVELQVLRAQSASAFGFIIEQLNDISDCLSDIRAGEQISRSAQLRAINLLNEQNADLENQLREQLDRKTEQLWEDVLYNIRRQNYGVAVFKGNQLENWLTSESQRLSPVVRGRAYLFVAQTALIAGSGNSDPSGQLSVAKSLVARARKEFGHDVSPENELRLANFEATLLAIEGRYDEALAILGNAVDAQSVSTGLLINIDRGNFAAAALLIHNRELNEKWCDHAVLVFARLGEWREGEVAVAWAIEHGDKLLQDRARVAFARGTLLGLSEKHSAASLSPLTITAAECATVQQSLTMLQAVVDSCVVAQQAPDGLEAEAITLAYTCCRLLGKVDEGRGYVKQLRSLRPVAIEYARAVLRSDAEAFDDLPSILRTDHPRSFEAHEVALLVDILNGLSPDGAIPVLEALVPLARKQLERERVAERLSQIGPSMSPENCHRARELLVRVVNPDSRYVKLMEAESALKNNDLSSCEALLSQIDDDSDFMVSSLLAELRVAQERHGEAAELLTEIGRKSCEPWLLKRAARLAFNAKPRRLDIVLRSLEDAVRVVPYDIEVNTNLAFAYVVLHAYPNAVSCFQRLHHLQPNNRTHLANLARSYVLANRPQEALEVYDSLCARDTVGLDVVCARAQLLADVGRPHDAFRSLDAQRYAHWDDVPFVLEYMNCAYRANEERRAQEAFERLWQLRAEGKLPPNVLEPKTADDLIAFEKDVRERREFCHQQLTGGKLPWLFVEHFLNNVPYWGWRIRTQEFLWYVDTPSNRAAYSVYATNGYAVRTSTDGRRSLEKLRCANRGQATVADLSALITLHRLNLLNQALSYFGRIVVPTSYLSDVVRDAGRLQPNQLSQKTSLTSIKEGLERNEITVAALPDPDEEGVVVDEYTEKKLYRLRDVVEVLTNAGRLSDTRRNAVLRVAHETAKSEETGRLLQPSDELTISLATLKVIAEYEILADLCAVFSKVQISPTDRDQLFDELRVYDLKAETRAWHKELWKLLNEDNRFEARALTRESGEPAEAALPEDASFETERIKAIDAPFLALQEGLPLLADDRVCQSIVLNSGHKCADAFGSDSLVLALKEHGLVTGEDASRAALMLIKWRYRFLWLPPETVECIRVTASRHDLQAVARYVHECMRDLGLFGGLEPTDPPTPIAFRFFQDWIKTVSEFVADLWLQESFEQEQVTDLTAWAIGEFLPVAPVVLGPGRGPLSAFTPFAVLGFVMSRLCLTINNARAQTAIECIARLLGLDSARSSRLIGDVVDGNTCDVRTGN